MLYKKYRLLVCVEYNGFNYIGWQKQKDKNKSSIQENIEISLAKIANHSVNIFCASRTDSGVHSLGQVFHFNTSLYIKESNWVNGLNSILNKDIYVKWVKYVSNKFHARFDAIARRYIYVISIYKFYSIFLYKLVTYLKVNYLNITSMIKGSKYLIGNYNFSSFSSVKGNTNNMFRKIFYIKIYKKNNYIFFDIKANSFLYKMIRNIVTSLVLVGLNKKPYYWIKSLLSCRIRYLKYNLIPSNGLYLHTVYYKNIKFL